METPEMEGTGNATLLAFARQRVDRVARAFHDHLTSEADSKEWRDKGEKLYEELREALNEVDRLEELEAAEAGQSTPKALPER